MQKNRKIIPRSTQTRLSSNEGAVPYKNTLLAKNSENSLKNALGNNKFNTFGLSKSIQYSHRKMPLLQKQEKQKKVLNSVERSDSVSVSSANNTEREIAEAVYLLRKEISEWKAQETLRSRTESNFNSIIVFFICTNLLH